MASNADHSPTFRADLRAQSKRRRERLSSLASAPPLRRRNDLLPPLAVEEVSPADLVSPARNVRRQEATHIREVAASIAELGFCDPVLIGSGNTILNGEIRIEAAKQLGLPRIPCIRVQHLTGVEQRLLRVASNRLAEKGGWNLEDLKIELEEFIVEQTPIEISGFSAPEIDQILLSDDPPPHERGPLDPAPGALAVAQEGDFFRLGEHTIVCGNATGNDVFAPLMRGDGPARLVMTDEPYNVRISGNVTGGPHREFAMASGEMSESEFLTHPDPEHVAEDLRERMRKGPVTLSENEVRRIIAMLEILSDRCGAAYQVVAQLADHAGMFHDPAVVRVMDLLAFPLRRGEIFPFDPKPAKDAGEIRRRKSKPVSKRKSRS